ncbi:MAG: rhomboid family intramembrane serine protease [Bacteroidales bacterium]|nr:rhomboid family intramembrane serine protease [Bacteroidales bacterium]
MPYIQEEGRQRPITVHLIIINVIFYLATKLNGDFMYSTFSLFYPATPWFKPWQVVSYMFMHGGFWHILFNMYSLYIFGMAVERIIGQKRFMILYFLAGLGAAATQIGVQALDTAMQGIPTVGASGCIYGVIIAFAMIFPEARLTLIFPPVTLSAKWMAIIFIGIELFTGVTGTQAGVAHFAHLGGALVGFLLIWWWYKRRPKNNDHSYVHYD